mmetsp:Transcript_5112/g.6766  ORF Transcript_5112/g.6766 Transcript_5112/m.6766 type:complete len:105 (+) Transcript_5112:110-424(+)
MLSGFDQNYKKAVESWRKASSKGNPIAEFNLAGCYQQGLGVIEKDANRATDLYSRSATGGYEPAQDRLEELIPDVTSAADSDNNVYRHTSPVSPFKKFETKTMK